MKGKGNRKAQKARYRLRYPEKIRAEHARYRLRHPEKVKAERARFRLKADTRNKEIVRLAKDGKPCVDCGGFFPPYVLDFDHVRGKKKFAISMRKTPPVDTLLAEIAKCDLVCANCHRIRTFTKKSVSDS